MHIIERSAFPFPLFFFFFLGPLSVVFKTGLERSHRLSQHDVIYP